MHAQVKSFIEENVFPLENELVERSMDPKLKWTHHPRLDELKVGRYTCNISHEMCTWFSCAFVCLLRLCNCKEWIPMVYLPMSFRVTSLPLGQPYIAPCSAIEITLKNEGKFDQYQANTKHDRVETLCVILGV